MPLSLKAIFTSFTFFLLFTSILLQANEHQAPLKSSQWSYSIDPYGSKATLQNQLMTLEGVWIHFKRIPRIDEQRNSWIELIYSPGNVSLAHRKKISLTYKCDTPLLVKLSQDNYGKDGDKSYAYYQRRLPKATEWTTKEVYFTNFSRPHWTPTYSKDQGMLLEKVNAIYLTPSMTDAAGGEATLEIKYLKILP
jgi:hypothetical protein